MEAKVKPLFKRAKELGPLFHVCVTLPTLVALLYYGIFASDVYVSESRFIVRSPNKPEATGFGMLLKTAGFSNSGDEVYAANDYLTSRDALRELNRGDAVARSYSAKNVSLLDRFDPVGFDHSFEALHRYFGKKVGLQYESSTSVTTLTVRAFNANDARRFNAGLLDQAERLVNKLNDRARTDLLDVAQREVDRSRAQARRASEALASYRDRVGVVDPQKQAEVQIQMVSKLQDELIASRIQLQQLRALAPKSSEIAPLEGRLEGLQQSIEVEMRRAAGGNDSLSRTAVEYQRLQFDEQFAAKQLTASLGSLEEARLEAQRKQAYVERIVEPNLSDDASEPHRLRGVFAAFALGLIAWGILSMLLASLKDHVE